jgi:hypothetical protein
MKHSNKAGVWTIVLLAGLAACSSGPEINPTREFLKKTCNETAAITSTRDRFRRQLNVANAQILNEEYLDARETLTFAEVTLPSAQDGEVDQRTTLAGWVSLSELYRKTVDYDEGQKHPELFAPANAALDRAIALLHQMQPVSMRTYYVRAIALEIRELRSVKNAASALVEAGAWADQIKDLRDRRRAYRGIARDLLRDDDYNAATEMLNRDTDPVWRIDAAVALTMPRPWHPYHQNAYFQSTDIDTVPYLKRPTPSSSDSEKGEEEFGIPLDYQSNFSDDTQQDGATTEPYSP